MNAKITKDQHQFRKAFIPNNSLSTVTTRIDVPPNPTVIEALPGCWTPAGASANRLFGAFPPVQETLMCISRLLARRRGSFLP
jgi:hypothetical protein